MSTFCTASGKCARIQANASLGARLAPLATIAWIFAEESIASRVAYSSTIITGTINRMVTANVLIKAACVGENLFLRLKYSGEKNIAITADQASGTRNGLIISITKYPNSRSAP